MAVGLFTMIVMLFLLVPKVDDSSTSLMTKTSFALSLSHDKHDSTLVLLLALDSLHVVIHVHESTQPGSVEGSITAWGVHSHLLLVANPFFRNECIVLALECGFVFI